MAQKIQCPSAPSLLRCAGAAGADGARFRGLGTLPVGLDEALQVRVFRAVEAFLFAPRRCHHRGAGGQIRIGADQDVGAVLCDVLQVCYLVLREVWGVGDPDRPVLQGVDGVLVADRLVVVAAVLPDRVVLATYGRALLVIHVPRGVLAGGTDVVGLYVAWGAAGGLLPGVDYCERDEPADEKDDDRANDQVSRSGASRPASSNPCAALRH